MRTLAENVGGTDLGRPYTSGMFSVARNGRAAFTSNTSSRPSDVAIVAPGGAPRVLTALNDDLFGNKTLGEVEADRVEESATTSARSKAGSSSRRTSTPRRSIR